MRDEKYSRKQKKASYFFFYVNMTFFLLSLLCSAFSYSSTRQDFVNLPADKKSLIVGNTCAHNDDHQEALDSQSPSFKSQIINMIGMLSIVLLLFFLFSFIMKKKLSIKNKSGKSLDLKILSSIQLGTKERILLIEVLSKKILIGITASNISVLHSFSSENETKD
jgi:flagellar biogenesis protein FliO